MCNIVYDKIGTTTKSGGSLNNPQASLIYSTNVTEPEIPRVRGKSIFLTKKPWMGSLRAENLDRRKKEMVLLIVKTQLNLTPPPTSTMHNVAYYGPNWPDLFRNRTFFGKEARKRSELVNKSLIFQQKWHI